MPGRGFWKRKKREAQRIARERMDILFGLARDAALRGDMERARRYVWLLRRIGMRYNVSVPTRYKVSMCRKCNAFLISGKNARIRLEKGRLRVECLECGYVRRFPYRGDKRGGEKEKKKRGRGGRHGG